MSGFKESRYFGLNPGVSKVYASMRVSVVLKRTVVADNDRCFDNVREKSSSESREL